MVTFRQVARSYISAVKAAEREQKRRNKEATRLYKEQAKQQELANANEALRNYDNYINILTSIHKNCSDKIDWQQIANDPQPVEPIMDSIHEAKAQSNFENFKPSFSDKLFGSKKKQEQLKSAIELAKKQDQLEYDLKLKAYQDELKDWNAIQQIAKGIAERNPQSYADAINFFDPFADISDLGSNIKMGFTKDYVEIYLSVNDSEVIPNYVLSQTKTGKLSQKDMPKGKFFELYQDYVCGGLLRVARETFAYLPVNKVIVHATSKITNTSTGHTEELAILSAIIPKETIENLNFSSIDPSDSMKNFQHNMKFNKTSGFSPVDKVEFSDKVV